MFHVGNICEMKQDSHQETKETIMSAYFFSSSCQLIRSKSMFNLNPIQVFYCVRKTAEIEYLRRIHQRTGYQQTHSRH